MCSYKYPAEAFQHIGEKDDKYLNDFFMMGSPQGKLVFRLTNNKIVDIDVFPQVSQNVFGKIFFV